MSAQTLRYTPAGANRSPASPSRISSAVSWLRCIVSCNWGAASSSRLATACRSSSPDAQRRSSTSMPRAASSIPASWPVASGRSGMPAECASRDSTSAGSAVQTNSS